MKRSVCLALSVAIVLAAATAFLKARKPVIDSKKQKNKSRIEYSMPNDLTDLTLLQSNGRKFDVSSLQGNYSVVVLGCLT